MVDDELADKINKALRLLEAEDKPTGKILKALFTHPNGITISDIKSLINISDSDLYKILKSLEEDMKDYLLVKKISTKYVRHTKSYSLPIEKWPEAIEYLIAEYNLKYYL